MRYSAEWPSAMPQPRAASSLRSASMAGCGVSFTELMDRLVHLALKRRREQEAKTVSYDQNIFAMGGGTKGGVKGIK